MLRQIRNEFPEIEWKNYRCLTHGWDHFVVILDEKTVFRTPKDSRYKNEFKNEIQLLRYLKKKVKVGIPEYGYVSQDKSFAGYNMLAGQELTTSRFRLLSYSEKEIVAKQLAEFLTTLHKTPISVIEKFHVKSDNQQQLYRKLVGESKKLLFPWLDRQDVRLIEQYFVELKTALDQSITHELVHNDLTGEHILWDAEDEQINIIDFSDCSFGDPASDFAGFLEYGRKFAKRVFDLYGGKKDNNMLDRSRLYFKRIPLYMMKDSLQGFPCTFEAGYKTFKKRFKA